MKQVKRWAGRGGEVLGMGEVLTWWREGSLHLGWGRAVSEKRLDGVASVVTDPPNRLPV